MPLPSFPPVPGLHTPLVLSHPDGRVKKVKRGYYREITGMAAYRRKRQRLMDNASTAVKEAHDAIAGGGCLLVQDLASFEAAVRVRAAADRTLREFYQRHKWANMKFHFRRRKDQGLRKLVKEIGEWARKGVPATTPIVFAIGNARPVACKGLTSAPILLLRKYLAFDHIVAVTNEFRTSQVCPECFGPLVRPRRQATCSEHLDPVWDEQERTLTEGERVTTLTTTTGARPLECVKREETIKHEDGRKVKKTFIERRGAVEGAPRHRGPTTSKAHGRLVAGSGFCSTTCKRYGDGDDSGGSGGGGCGR